MYKHLTIEKRVLIEDRLNKKNSFRSIAKELKVSPSTILREVQRHTMIIKATENICSIKKDCIYKHLCNVVGCESLCSGCRKVNCNKYCTEFVSSNCPRLENVPHLCNGCNRFYLCKKEKRVYRGNTADDTYKKDLSSSRSGFDVTDEEMSRIDRLASPLIKNGLSPYHVKQTFGDDIPVSESTLRRMIDKCELNARNIDLRDKLKRSPRSTSRNTVRNKALSISKVGHFYEDYLRYVKDNDIFTVEMDCVEGRKGEKEALLTLTWKELSLQIALFLEEKTSENVIFALDKLEEALGESLFMKVFPLILTDNGPEFNNISAMETSKIGCKRTKIFFCDPRHSEQKGSCENHHKMIRYCIPKGTSLKPYSQSDISLMMNHINSYKRKALFGKSAYDLARGALPEDFFVLLGLEEVAPDKIILNPSIFCHSNCNSKKTLHLL